MITLPPQITTTFVPITAGIIVSLINKYTINGTWYESVKQDEVDSESESEDTTKTEINDSLRRISAITATTLPSHPIHSPHHVYYYMHQ